MCPSSPKLLSVNVSRVPESLCSWNFLINRFVSSFFKSPNSSSVSGFLPESDLPETFLTFGLFDFSPFSLSPHQSESFSADCLSLRSSTLPSFNNKSDCFSTDSPPITELTASIMDCEILSLANMLLYSLFICFFSIKLFI